MIKKIIFIIFFIVSIASFAFGFKKEGADKKD